MVKKKFKNYNIIFHTHNPTNINIYTYTFIYAYGLLEYIGNY